MLAKVTPVYSSGNKLQQFYSKSVKHTAASYTEIVAHENKIGLFPEKYTIIHTNTNIQEHSTQAE